MGTAWERRPCILSEEFTPPITLQISQQVTGWRFGEKKGNDMRRFLSTVTRHHAPSRTPSISHTGTQGPTPRGHGHNLSSTVTQGKRVDSSGGGGGQGAFTSMVDPTKLAWKHQMYMYDSVFD